MKSATRFAGASRLIALSAGVLSCVIGPVSAGQIPEQPTPPPAATPVPPETAPLEDEKLDQYADAYVDIADIETQASADLAEAEDAAAALAIKEKAEGAIIEAIERSGLELDEFNQITEIAAVDEDVRSRIADRVEKRRRI